MVELEYLDMTGCLRDIRVYSSRQCGRRFWVIIIINVYAKTTMTYFSGVRYLASRHKKLCKRECRFKVPLKGKGKGNIYVSILLSGGDSNFVLATPTRNVSAAGTFFCFS